MPLERHNFTFNQKDDYTDFITGYMKIPTESLFSHLKYFPSDITTITNNYVGDHFIIYRGSYRWKMSQPTINKILNANNKDVFESETFSLCKMNWQLFLYPNGDATDCEGSSNFYLALQKVPPKWKKVMVCWKLRCEQIDREDICIGMFDGNTKRSGWGDNILSFEELQDNIQSNLDFTVHVQILRIELSTNKNNILYNYLTQEWDPEKSQSFTWKIDSELIKKMKTASHLQKFISPIYYDMWCIALFPNDSGMTNVDLQLCGLPNGADKLTVDWSVKIPECNNESEWRNDFNAEISRYGSDDLFSFDEFKTYEELTIIVDINKKEQEPISFEIEWSEYSQQRQRIAEMLMQKVR